MSVLMLQLSSDWIRYQTKHMRPKTWDELAVQFVTTIVKKDKDKMGVKLLTAAKSRAKQ